MTPEEYREYLASPHWRNMRRRALAAAGDRCQACGSTHKLHVHHRSYKNLGYEDLEDLRVLCHDCHQRVHDLPLRLDEATDYVTATVVHFIGVDHDIRESVERHPRGGR